MSTIDIPERRPLPRPPDRPATLLDVFGATVAAWGERPALDTPGALLSYRGGWMARNPRDVPRAVILSILIGAGIYTLLQFAFIGSLDPRLLASAGTWTNLGAGNAHPEIVALNAGPFYEIAKVAGLAWRALILRLDAVVSPFGTSVRSNCWRMAPLRDSAWLMRDDVVG